MTTTDLAGRPPGFLVADHLAVTVKPRLLDAHVVGGTTVFFGHPKTTEAVPYLIEVVQEGRP